MNKCSTAQIASIALWISVTVIFLTGWITATVRYHEAHEDSELGRGSAVVTLTHPAFLGTLGAFVLLASGASYVRMKECGASAKATEEMISTFMHSGFDTL
jgi:hypothetical protein